MQIVFALWLWGWIFLPKICKYWRCVVCIFRLDQRELWQWRALLYVARLLVRTRLNIFVETQSTIHAKFNGELALRDVRNDDMRYEYNVVVDDGVHRMNDNNFFSALHEKGCGFFPCKREIFKNPWEFAAKKLCRRSFNPFRLSFLLWSFELEEANSRWVYLSATGGQVSFDLISLCLSSHRKKVKRIVGLIRMKLIHGSRFRQRKFSSVKLIRLNDERRNIHFMKLSLEDVRLLINWSFSFRLFFSLVRCGRSFRWLTVKSFRFCVRLVVQMRFIEWNRIDWFAWNSIIHESKMRSNGVCVQTKNEWKTQFKLKYRTRWFSWVSLTRKTLQSNW